MKPKTKIKHDCNEMIQTHTNECYNFGTTIDECDCNCMCHKTKGKHGQDIKQMPAVFVSNSFLPQNKVKQSFTDAVKPKVSHHVEQMIEEISIDFFRDHYGNDVFPAKLEMLQLKKALRTLAQKMQEEKFDIRNVVFTPEQFVKKLEETDCCQYCNKGIYQRVCPACQREHEESARKEEHEKIIAKDNEALQEDTERLESVQEQAYTEGFNNGLRAGLVKYNLAYEQGKKDRDIEVRKAFVWAKEEFVRHPDMWYVLDELSQKLGLDSKEKSE